MKKWYEKYRKQGRYLLLGILALVTLAAPWSKKAELGDLLVIPWLLILFEEANYYLAKKYRPLAAILLACLLDFLAAASYLAYNFWISGIS